MFSHLHIKGSSDVIIIDENNNIIIDDDWDSAEFSNSIESSDQMIPILLNVVII